MPTYTVNNRSVIPRGSLDRYPSLNINAFRATHFVYVIGASFSFKYPPTQDHIAAVLGKKIYIIGGMQLFPEREKNRLHPLNEIFVIDTDTSQGKTDKAALRQEIRSTLPNTFGSGCAVAKQKIYLFGGGLNPAEKIPRYSNDLFCFDVNLTEWLGVSVKGEKPAGRSGLGMCTIGDQIVLFGGYGPQHDDSFRKRGFSWKQRRKGGEGGWNNELAVFDLKDPYEGKYNLPHFEVYLIFSLRCLEMAR